jgi:hypothetical protein
VTNVAIQGLDNMMLGERALKVKKASIGITQVSGEMGVNAMSMLAGTTSTDAEVSRVIQLLNMVTPDELMDNDDYEGKSPSERPMLFASTDSPLRNPGRRARGVREVRQDPVAQDSPAGRRQQTVCRRGQDLHQI